MDLHTLMIFGLASFVLVATPGPDMLLVVARSATQGWFAGFVTQLGVSAGSFCHALALAFGLSQLFLLVPYAYDAVRFAGVAYLLFLAWQALTAPEPSPETQGALRLMSNAVLFRQGMLSNVLNPKVALFYLALFPQFISPETGHVALQVMILAVVLNVIGLIVIGVVIVVTGQLHRWSPASGRLRYLPRIFLASVFGGLAARLLFDGQR